MTREAHCYRTLPPMVFNDSARRVEFQGIGGLPRAYVKAAVREQRIVPVDCSSLDAPRRYLERLLCRLRDMSASMRFSRGFSLHMTALGEQAGRDLEAFLDDGQHQINLVSARRRQAESGDTYIFEALLSFAGWRRQEDERRVFAFLIARDGGHCVWCSRPLNDADRRATIDHIRPRGHGGSSDLDNCFLACFSCNEERGMTRADKWLAKCQEDRLPDEAAVMRALARVNIGHGKAKRKSQTR